jgi:hypothetical protein
MSVFSSGPPIPTSWQRMANVADYYDFNRISITDEVDKRQIRPTAGALTNGEVAPSSDMTPLASARLRGRAPDRLGSDPVEWDVLGRIQRVLELEAVRVDREDR